MDLKTFAVEETGLLELVGPDDQPLIGDDGKPMTVTVYGPGSKQYAKATAVQSNRMTDRLKKKGKSDMTAEEKTKENTAFLTACTAAFSGNVSYGELEGEDMIRAIYSDQKLGFIAEQVAKHIQDWANFTKGSTTR